MLRLLSSSFSDRDSYWFDIGRLYSSVLEEEERLERFCEVLFGSCCDFFILLADSKNIAEDVIVVFVCCCFFGDGVL